MKKFHVSILFATRDGEVVKSYTLTASSVEDLKVQIAFLTTYEIGVIEALKVEVQQVTHLLDVTAILVEA